MKRSNLRTDVGNFMFCIAFGGGILVIFALLLCASVDILFSTNILTYIFGGISDKTLAKIGVIWILTFFIGGMISDDLRQEY